MRPFTASPPTSSRGSHGALRERRRTDLKARLEHLEGLERAAGTWDRTKFAESLRGSLADWRGILEGNPVQARQIRRKLLVGRLTLSPTVRSSPRHAQHRHLPHQPSASAERVAASARGKAPDPPPWPVDPQLLCAVLQAGDPKKS
jgi:hypothetical protein